ncbi:phenylpyruvate tautomerase MIF-related protein [Roseburia sp. 499]|uniref:phenylpyruvate tautomerase MIF-related protein n=1 Tax=Roseburia sp. 499 TaxID=1261634 RepID=UPI0009511E1D|nr:phenylpyruvate tautomerase MIF-related protein [Roseburia sp. 499]WVK71035.1 phenylpyruvate tautomerase MIF-related protein [Roseburia sp. 499]
MPFIDSKVSVSISPEQEAELVKRLGQAISIIPGKSESWLMTGFEQNYHLYFRGENDTPTAFIEVKVFGSENKSAFSELTAEICKIFKDVLNIPADHVYIKYEAVTNWGWNGGNF